MERRIKTYDSVLVNIPVVTILVNDSEQSGGSSMKLTEEQSSDLLSRMLYYDLTPNEALSKIFYDEDVKIKEVGSERFFNEVMKEYQVSRFFADPYFRDLCKRFSEFSGTKGYFYETLNLANYISNLKKIAVSGYPLEPASENEVLIELYTKLNKCIYKHCEQYIYDYMVEISFNAALKQNIKMSLAAKNVSCDTLILKFKKAHRFGQLDIKNRIEGSLNRLAKKIRF